MTLLEMIERVQADFPNYKTGQLVRDLNAAMHQFVFESYLNKKRMDLKSQSLMTEENKEIVDDRGIALFVEYDGASYPVPTDCSRIYEFELPDDRNHIWFDISGSVVTFYSSDIRSEGYEYEPVGPINAVYWANPLTLSEPGDEPPFPAMLHEAVVDLVLRSMYLRNQNQPMFQYCMSEYLRLRKEAKRYGSREKDGTALDIQTPDRRYHNAKDH